MQQFKKGEIWYVDFPKENPPSYVLEGTHPAVILHDYHKFPKGTVMVAPITGLKKQDGKTKKLLLTDIILYHNEYKNQSFLKKDSKVKLEQIRTVSTDRLLVKMGELKPEHLKELELKLLAVFGLEDLVTEIATETALNLLGNIFNLKNEG